MNKVKYTTYLFKNFREKIEEIKRATTIKSRDFAI